MPEGIPKLPQQESPVARAGAGDISERELSRERHNLQTTPPARVQPAHPKKQLFSAPVNKFTATCPVPSPNLERIRSCLDQYSRTPARPAKIGPKAVSMEDLTPTKRFRRLKREPYLPVVRQLGPAEEQAAATIYRFLMLCAWRRRRGEVRCIRKTLETQVSTSERLRIQVSTLKSLLDSDNAKVRLAMRELERLKLLLRDKEAEKAVLEKEKRALENDVCAVEDRASEMSIGWRNCRNELEGVRAAAQACERALNIERAAACDARRQRDRAYAKLALVKEDLSHHEALLAEAEAEMSALRREADERARMLAEADEKLKIEQEARARCCSECAALSARVEAAAMETAALRGAVGALRGQLQRLQDELGDARARLEWRPLTRVLGAARWCLQQPLSLREALMWALVPARHGC